MASPTMALAPMASLKVMASNLMPMVNNPLPMVNNLQLLILLRVMDKHILSNLLEISLPSSLLTPSHLRMVNTLPIPSSLSILKVLQ